jgi:predicted TIM-barrel fold metal-dependent hydrolase
VVVTRSKDLAVLRQSMRETESPVVDVAAWVGEYPFRGINGGAREPLKAVLDRLRIERAIASPYEGIFWENGLEVFERARDAHAADDRVELWPVVRPGFTRGLEKLLDRHRPRGLRLVPNYHGYRLSDPAVADVMAIARARRMIVQVFQRIADERWHFMLKVPAVEPFDLDYLTAMFPDQKILITGMNSVAPLASRLRQLPGLYADVSRTRGPQFAIENMVKTLPAEKLVFGSLWPVQIVEATLWQVTTANIEEGVRQGILHENARRMLSTIPGT